MTPELDKALHDVTAWFDELLEADSSADAMQMLDQAQELRDALLKAYDGQKAEERGSRQAKADAAIEAAMGCCGCPRLDEYAAEFLKEQVNT